MGIVAVLVILGTGLVSVLYLVIAAGGRLGPVYLGVLSAKLAAAGGLLAVAAVNRLWLTPMAHRNPGAALQGLRLSLLLEQALALGLLASVTLLGQLDPTM